jgi:FkbM family methyltransferase
MNLIPGFRNSLTRLRRKMFEAVGSARYSRMALNELDKKLERHLDFDGGFFVEAGANDGLAQSNTYYFEAIRGWTGLLVEPNPDLAASCRNNRKGIVIEAALVAQHEPHSRVELHRAGLMSTITGALGGSAVTKEHVMAGLTVQRLQATPAIYVPARTLSDVLDAAQIQRSIDLLSLDVEGGEIAALRGIDFNRHAPRFICIEVRDANAIAAVLEPRYRLVEVLSDVGSHCDILYELR